MKNTCILILPLVWISSLCAQVDRDNFEKIFNEETIEPNNFARENHSGAYLHTAPQNIPSWFINPPVSTTNEVYSIGISDPEMDTTAALEMAIYRAQIMANVLRYSTTQLLCDFFVNEKTNTSNVVYEHFSRINAVLPINGKFEVVDTYRNNFDETMVLIKYFSQPEVNTWETNKIKLELYRSEVNSKNYGVFESIFELLVQGDTTEPNPMFYQLTELGTRYDVLSAVNKEQKQVPIYKLAYYGLNEAGDSNQYSYFSHGLWKEYFKSVMVYIIGKAREKPENIKNLSEIYTNEKYNDKSLEKLTRGISVNKMRFVVTHVSAVKDNLKVRLQELPIDNQE